MPASPRLRPAGRSTQPRPRRPPSVRPKRRGDARPPADADHRSRASHPRPSDRRGSADPSDRTAASAAAQASDGVPSARARASGAPGGEHCGIRGPANQPIFPPDEGFLSHLDSAFVFTMPRPLRGIFRKRRLRPRRPPTDCKPQKKIHYCLVLRLGIRTMFDCSKSPIPAKAAFPGPARPESAPSPSLSPEIPAPSPPSGGRSRRQRPLSPS